jgi:hypothetical protein
MASRRKDGSTLAPEAGLRIMAYLPLRTGPSYGCRAFPFCPETLLA